MTLKKAYYGDYGDRLQKRKVVIAVICLIIFFGAVTLASGSFFHDSDGKSPLREHAKNKGVPSDLISPNYSGNAYEVVNENIPYFTDEEITASIFEDYSPLDKLGRCGPAYACLGLETMPLEERGAIGMIKPSGWHTVRYDDLIEDRYLYNRCHLIAFMLSGENANELNLITGTRYMNVTGMLPFEKLVADYINETQNHVLYRVTPVFEGKNLVATGVLMEAISVEDFGTGVMYNVFVFNVQPGIEINYGTGESWREE